MTCPHCGLDPVCSLCRGDQLAPTGRRVELFSALPAPTQNAFNGQKFGSDGMRRRWEREIFALAMAEGVSKSHRKNRLELTRYMGPRNQFYDHANLVGGCKPMIDAFKRIGLIVDDRPGYFEGYYHQERARERPGTLIVLTEILEGQEDLP